MKTQIYLDNAATTALSPAVLEDMMPYLRDFYGNPSSVYDLGRSSRSAIEAAREKVAAAIGAKTGEIYFTGSGTEADNWALKGAAYAYKNKGKHIITSAIEHHAVLHTCEELERQGYRITYLPVDELGRVSPTDFEKAITEETILASIMLANNEIGTIQPIRELAAIAKAKGIIFHTDAVQAVGQIPVDVSDLGVDLLTMSGHKFHGPKGIGALYVRRGVKLSQLVHGGAQESGKRAGTENVAAIVGMGSAIALAAADCEERMKKVASLRDYYIAEIAKRIPHSRLNGDPVNRLPGNANHCFSFIEGESLLLMLDMKGIAASSGSACTSGSLDPSHVLLAIGLPHEIAHGSLRISISESNTKEEIDTLLNALEEIVARLRAMSPLAEGK